MSDPLLAQLPARFRASDVKFVTGETFVGSPKESGSDNAAHVPLPHQGPIVFVDCTFDANGASEALKLPLKFWIAIVRGKSIGGVEDCVDINRGAHQWFLEHEFVRNGAQRDVTCKGGAWNINFYRCPGLSKVRLGDYTKYDKKAVYDGGRRATKAGMFRLARPATREITILGGSPEVECIHASNPLGGHARTKSPLRRWAAPYFWGRSTFWKEVNPPKEADLLVDPRELEYSEAFPS